MSRFDTYWLHVDLIDGFVQDSMSVALAAVSSGNPLRPKQVAKQIRDEGLLALQEGMLRSDPQALIELVSVAVALLAKARGAQLDPDFPADLPRPASELLV